MGVMSKRNRFFPAWEDECDLVIEIDGETEDELVSLADVMDVSLDEVEYMCLRIGLSALRESRLLTGIADQNRRSHD